MMLAFTSEQMWFASRGAGTITMVLLTTSVVLGVVTAGGWRSEQWPRFVSVELHRNISLLAIALMCVHVVTVELDPFVTLRWWDAIIPFQARYRPFWVGLGVLTAETLAALAVTSGIRGLIGVRAWRMLHWAGYAAWLAAMYHSLGSGTDAREGWSNAVNVVCALAVVAAVFARAMSGWRSDLRRDAVIRGAAMAAVLLAVAQLGVWASHGPLRPDWKLHAGTPAQSPAPVPVPAQPGPGGVVNPG